MTDNIGVVWSHKKGSSRDLYTHTISKACDFLCQKMNINLRVEKVRRCSDQASIAADLLSKGHLHEAINTMGSVDHSIPYIPRTIVHHLDHLIVKLCQVLLVVLGGVVEVPGQCGALLVS